MPPPLPQTDVAPWAGTLMGGFRVCAGSRAEADRKPSSPDERKPRRPRTQGRRRTTVRRDPRTPVSEGLQPSGEDRDRVRGNCLDLCGGALELVVREHGCALERQLALDLDPRAASAVLVTHLDGDRSRNTEGAEDDHVERVAALPG